MIIIPAIDILDNEAVRLYKGDYSQKTVYSKAPWELIMAFEKTGAKLVHIVDLNGARNASDTNRDTIIKMKKACPELKIELGGGIRDMEKLKFYEGLGIDRFILGTAAVIYPDFLEAALKYVGKERLVVSVDAFEGIVRIAGWEEK
ncbi:MAG TPA: HisA/HisF-related TIM barrel protein, partial [Leptospiraceae bacterium]|nr:HisA/HisF-related TIM barrel protein [Leptospiraceae bacterium]